MSILFTKKIIAILSITLCGMAGLSVVAMYDYVNKLPDPKGLLHGQIPSSTKIFDKHGLLLYEIHGEYKRTEITLNEVSSNLISATIAIEDKSFYEHNGISPEAIVRAAWINYKNKSISQGGSTITQQLAKNALLDRQRTWERKINEAILAIRLEQLYSKEQILEMYLNQIPYGRNAYGIEAASQTYFGKSANALTIAESAYLASLPKAPSYFMKPENEQALKNRKNQVLANMLKLGFIDEVQFQSAKDDKVTFRKTKTPILAPHFVMWVEKYLKQVYGQKLLEEGGLEVHTTLDYSLQKIAEKSISDREEINAKKYNAHNAGLVAMDTQTGQVLAMVGGKDYFGDPEPAGCISGRTCVFDASVNTALSPLQPGSSFKPYTYLTAFSPEFKYSPSSIVLDVAKNFAAKGTKAYIPRNYSGKQYGPIPMRQALAGSLNIAAVRTLEAVGTKNVINTAQKLGITTELNKCGMSLTLGGCEVKLIEHTAAYSVIGNGGVSNGINFILKIEDRDGKILESYQAKNEQVVDPQAVYQLVSIMTDNDARSFIFGKKSPLTLPDRIVAAKTGTTQKYRDGWTLGFTPQITTGVWVGNNNATPMKYNSDGVFVAAPIWHAFMEEAHKTLPVLAFAKPEGIVELKINPRNGLLASPTSKGGKTEIFASYNTPTRLEFQRPRIAKAKAVKKPASSPVSNQPILDVGGVPDNENLPLVPAPSNPIQFNTVPDKPDG